jgi:hypothetical protein
MICAVMHFCSLNLRCRKETPDDPAVYAVCMSSDVQAVARTVCGPVRQYTFHFP